MLQCGCNLNTPPQTHCHAPEKVFIEALPCLCVALHAQERVFTVARGSSLSAQGSSVFQREGHQSSREGLHSSREGHQSSSARRRSSPQLSLGRAAPPCPHNSKWPRAIP